MTIKLWNKKKEQEEIHTNVSHLEHRILRCIETEKSKDINALLITFCDEAAVTIFIPIDEFNIDEISQYNLGSYDNE